MFNERDEDRASDIAHDRDEQRDYCYVCGIKGHDPKILCDAHALRQSEMIREWADRTSAGYEAMSACPEFLDGCKCKGCEDAASSPREAAPREVSGETSASRTPDTTRLPIEGVWLRGEGDEINVYVQVAGDWYRCISESKYNPETISHIAEPRGVSKWPKLERNLVSDE